MSLLEEGRFREVRIAWNVGADHVSFEGKREDIPRAGAPLWRECFGEKENLSRLAERRWGNCSRQLLACVKVPRNLPCHRRVVVEVRVPDRSQLSPS